MSFKLATWNIEDSRGTQGTSLDFSKRRESIIRYLSFYLSTLDILLVQEIRSDHLEIFESFKDAFHVYHHPYNQEDNNPMNLVTLVRKTKLVVDESSIIKKQYSDFSACTKLPFMKKRSVFALKVRTQGNETFWVINTHNFLAEEEKWCAMEGWKELIDRNFLQEPFFMGLDTNFFFDMEGKEMLEKAKEFMNVADCYKFAADVDDVEESMSKGYSCYKEAEISTSGSFFGYSIDKQKREVDMKFNNLTPLDRIFYSKGNHIEIVKSGCQPFENIRELVYQYSHNYKENCLSDEARDKSPSDHIPLFVNFSFGGK